MSDTISFTLRHHIQYDVVNATAYEKDIVIAELNGKQVEQQFNSTVEALIWLVEQSTGKDVKVKHYFSGPFKQEKKEDE